jgi:hypothetical protein
VAVEGTEKMNCYKILVTGILWSFIPATAFTQRQQFDAGPFSFSSATKILKDGSITDMGIGYAYTENFAGELRLRFSNEIKTSRFDEKVPDSLNASNENNFEIFALPLKYMIMKNKNIEFHTGAGLYYSYGTLTEKGYFNMPALETLGKEKVHSFSNDFSRHILGPDIETGFNCRVGWFNVFINAGIVPIFWLYSRQKMGIVPLMEPDAANYSQTTQGTPFFYTDAGFTLFKYILLVFLYDSSRLNYKVIDFDNNLKWYNPERAVVSQSLRIEASLLIPVRGMAYQIGYGHTFDTTRLDSAPPVRNNKQYLILSVKTITQ